MEKYEFIKYLTNKKLVIGNGFDLHCGLKSKYSDFFERNEENNKNFHNEIRNIFNKIDEDKLILTNDEILGLFSRENWKKTNMWELFFHLIYLENEKTKKNEWNDIEKTIENSLLKTESTLKMSWDDVRYIYGCEEHSNETNTNTLFLMAVMYLKYGSEIKNEADFFNTLLKELNDFENIFSTYLYNHYYDKIYKRHFCDAAEDLLRLMCCDSEYTSIESFNYFTHDYYGIKKNFKNINGNISNPIFGIDSDGINPSSVKYIFTKTNRRLELDFFSTELNKNISFNNLIIYGHSLNKADYNYFFPLFDKLDLVNNNASGKIVFEYSVYGTRTEYDVAMELKQKIYKILKSYAEYKGIKQYQRFIDFLISDQRIITYKL